MAIPAPSPNALTTIERVKEFLKEKSDQNNGVIQRMINALSQVFETERRRAFKQRDVIDYRADGSGTQYLLLPLTPVQTVTKLELHDPLTFAILDTITDTTEFALKGKDQSAGVYFD